MDIQSKILTLMLELISLLERADTFSTDADTHNHILFDNVDRIRLDSIREAILSLQEEIK